MGIVDPRERYDDLLVTESRERLEPEEFREATGYETATVGWLVLGFVFDGAGRLLLVDEPGFDGWKVPAGSPEPGESLPEAVVREVREETGVECTPVRPHAVDEFTFANERTGETDGWTTVFFEAAAETTEIDDDPGLAGEEIDDAGWFERLPEEAYAPEPTGAAYRRCLDRRTAR